MEAIVSVLGGKWKPGILFNLLESPHRFGALRRRLGPISEKMLAQQLRELELEGVVVRTDFGEMPPRVVYSLTEYGRTLEPVLRLMGDWGAQHVRLHAAPPGGNGS